MTTKTERRRRQTGRSESGSFIAVPHAVLKSDAYRTLSAHGVKLLFDLAAQYRGKNNGDLCATWRIMQPLNWRSRQTLERALRELQEHGLIEKTRQGGRHQCNLFALTWCTIDECKGKLDVPTSHAASGRWKTWRAAPEKQNASTPSVSMRHAYRVNAARQAA